MNVKFLMYCVFIPLSFLALDSVNIQNVFKKNRYMQARFLYVFLTFALSYLVVNFLMDFYTVSQIF